MGIEAGLVDVIEKSGHSVKVFLGHRIVFVIVTTGATESQAKKSGAGRCDSVRYIFDAEFLFDAATFIGRAVRAVESSRQDLVATGFGQKIPRQLPGDKLIVGEVLVEGAND